MMARKAEDSAIPSPQLVKLGLNDEFASIVGSNAYLREHYGLSAACLVERMR